MLTKINNSAFEATVLNNKKPVVVEVYTQNCLYCKRLDPIFDKTANDNKDNYDFFKIDAQNNIKLATRYKVLTVPTLLFFSHGILVHKKRGVSSQKQIEKKLLPMQDYTEEIAKKKERTGFLKCFGV